VRKTAEFEALQGEIGLEIANGLLAQRARSADKKSEVTPVLNATSDTQVGSFSRRHLCGLQGGGVLTAGSAQRSRLRLPVHYEATHSAP
jgi:hypothetical protein